MIFDSFTYDSMPGRIVFGVGAADRLGAEIERLKARRVLIVSSPGRRGHAEELAAAVDAAGIWSDSIPHVPVEIAEEAYAAVRAVDADCVVAIGGGSALGFGKAIGREFDIDQIMLPTTYSGTEMTPILGMLENGVKRAKRDMKLLPEVVIYDPMLTLGLPPYVTATSGMNAIAHCVETLYTRQPSPMITLASEEAARALAHGLPRAVKEPSNIEARTETLYGAYLAGAALAVGVALHHRICHVLGGTLGVGHGEANSVMLPHVVRFNETAAPDAIGRVARAFGTDDAAGALFDLVREMGAPSSLKGLGVREADLDRVAELTVETTDYNPRSVDLAGVRAILDGAYHGRRP